MKQRRTPINCLRGCEGVPVHSRGLCRHCYVMAWKLVQEGETTWKKLVKRGLATESNRESFAREARMLCKE